MDCDYVLVYYRYGVIEDEEFFHEPEFNNALEQAKKRLEIKKKMLARVSRSYTMGLKCVLYRGIAEISEDDTVVYSPEAVDESDLERE